MNGVGRGVPKGLYRKVVEALLDKGGMVHLLMNREMCERIGIRVGLIDSNRYFPSIGFGLYVVEDLESGEKAYIAEFPEIKFVLPIKTPGSQESKASAEVLAYLYGFISKGGERRTFILIHTRTSRNILRGEDIPHTIVNPYITHIRELGKNQFKLYRAMTNDGRQVIAPFKISEETRKNIKYTDIRIKGVKGFGPFLNVELPPDPCTHPEEYVNGGEKQ